MDGAPRSSGLSQVRKAHDLDRLWRADAGGEGAEQEPEWGAEQVGLEAGAEVAAEQASGTAAEAQEPVGGDVACSGRGEQRHQAVEKIEARSARTQGAG